MDRGRCFSILGLSENATKEQVKRAYGRKIARYKGPDYAEEPAYVERKLAQLHQAYQEAYEMAADGNGTYQQPRVERDVDRIPKKKPAKASRLLEEERDAEGPNKREKFHQWLEQRDDVKQSRKDGTGKNKSVPKLAKPDFSKLKDRLQEIKAEIATQLELNSDSSDEKDMIDLETEPLAEEKMITDFDVDDMDEDDRYTPPIASESKSNVGEIVKIVISIAAAVIMLAGGCGDSSIDDTFYEEEPLYAYIYDQSSLEIEENDSMAAALANESYMVLSDSGENGSSFIKDETESEYQEKADAFAKKYWNMESLSEVTGYLYGQYGQYSIAPDAPLATQLDAIFAFYGFASLEDAAWYDQPYTGESICGYGDYLDYLNQFYEAQ